LGEDKNESGHGGAIAADLYDKFVQWRQVRQMFGHQFARSNILGGRL
jgi:hypothetical protein